MTILTPFARTVSTMLVVRGSLGIGEGLSPPSLYSTVARWIPAAERSRAIAFVATGMCVGLILAFPAAVWIMARLGWPWVFYLFGLLGLVWWVAWHLLVTDKPEDHPCISEAEVQTILHGQPSTTQAEAIPWQCFFREPAFLVLICAYFSTHWTCYIFLNRLPAYLVQGAPIFAPRDGPIRDLSVSGHDVGRQRSGLGGGRHNQGRHQHHAGLQAISDRGLSGRDGIFIAAHRQ